MIHLSIHDYQAIKEADIDLKGITVLAGLNGAGKSTLAKWLYYAMNVAHRFEALKTDEIRNHVKGVATRLNALFVAHDYSAGIAVCANIDKYLPRFNVNNKAFIYEVFSKLTDAFASFLAGLGTKERNALLKSQSWHGASAYMAADRAVSPKWPWSKKAAALAASLNDGLTALVEHVAAETEQRSLAALKQQINATYADAQMFPPSLRITEDGVALVADKSFAASRNILNVCYIDSPFATTVEASNYAVWSELRRSMLKGNHEIPQEAQVVLAYIRRKTKVVVKVEDDAFGIDKEVFFYENGRKIMLAQAATGVKTFAYISRLIENGTLNKHAMLLIDEPEAHLHPQWIVEFARVLVMLHKHMGVTLLLATHNPDMVSAIRNIAEREGAAEATSFYLAEADGNTGRFTFKNTNGEIGAIFKSFNIALSRIKQYGAYGDNQ